MGVRSIEDSYTLVDGIFEADNIRINSNICYNGYKKEIFMKNIVILGAGGFAREVAWLIEDINDKKSEWNLLGYIEEYTDNIGKNLNGKKILGTFEWIKENTNDNLYYICAIGSPGLKEKFSQLIKNFNIKPAILIHPNVQISKYNEIGEGSIICAGCIITVNIKIGKHVILNIDSTVGHNSIIGDFTTILPSVNISGNVNIGCKCDIGTGTKIIPHVTIGDNAIVGAGAVVLKNTDGNTTSVGMPSKVIKYN